MERIGAIIPVTPVPLAAAALLSFGQTMIPKAAVLDRMDQLRDRLGAVNAKVVRGGARDRKSTRLNSSHGYISYAVFCLKKKNTRASVLCGLAQSIGQLVLFRILQGV